MSAVASLIQDLVNAGVPAELIGRTAALLAQREVFSVSVPDEQAERRRAKDRERKRLRNSAESAEIQGPGDDDLPPPVSPLVPFPRPLTQNPPLSPTIPTAGAGVIERGEETIVPSPSPSVLTAPNARASPVKRGSSLPADWQPDAEQIHIARTEGIPDEQILRIAAEFRDYWSDVPGERGRKLSWTGTWRNNCRKASERFQRTGSASSARHGSPGGGRLAAYQRAAAHFSPTHDVPRERPDLSGHGGRVLDL